MLGLSNRVSVDVIFFIVVVFFELEVNSTTEVNKKYSNSPQTLRFLWGNVDYESHQTIRLSHVFSSIQMKQKN